VKRYFPCVDAFDGNEYCTQLAIAKIILCCNVRSESHSTVLPLEEESYKNDLMKYCEFSANFILSFRIYVNGEEKKKEKNGLIMNALNHTLNNTVTPFLNKPLRTMTILLQKFLDFCPLKFRSFVGKLEKLLPYVLVHSDSTDISLGKQKSKHNLQSFSAITVNV
jgi:hypothetical protein